MDRHPAQIAAFWKPFGVEYQRIPEEQPPKDDWWTGQPLTYDVEHTDGYFLIDGAGRARFIDTTAPDMKGQLNKKLTGSSTRTACTNSTIPRQPDWTTAEALASISWLLGTNVPAPRLVIRAGLRRATLVVPAALVGLALVLSACGNSSVTDLSAPPTTNPSLTLTLQHSPEGPILATGAGDTLYDFVPDTPTHSACLNDGCVLQWPPLLKSGPVQVGKGLDPSLVGTLRRPGGSTQLSYGGHPLYTYNMDIHARDGDRAGHRPGRWTLVRAQRQGAANHDVFHRDHARGQRLSRPGITWRDQRIGC